MGTTGDSVAFARNILNGISVSPQFVFYSTNTLRTRSNSTVAQSIVNDTGSFGASTIPANFVQQGTIIEVKGVGYLTTDSVLPTLLITLLWGNTTIATSGAVTFLSQISTAKMWEYNAVLRFVSSGASGSVITSQALWLNDLNNNSFGSSPGAITVDTTVTSLIDIKAQWSAASANNSITGSQWWFTVSQ